MLTTALDLETGLFGAGLLAPPPVCMSLYDGEERALVGSENGWANLRRAAIATVGSPGRLIVGLNIAYDMSVLVAWLPELVPVVFDAYHENRIHDIAVLEQLGDNANPYGGHEMKKRSLEMLARNYGVAELDKENSPRKDYARLLFKSPSEYPQRHREYALSDGDVTHEVYNRVRGRYPEHKVAALAVAEQSRHAFWLFLSSCLGFRVNPDSLEQLKKDCQAAQERLSQVAREMGFLRENGTKNMAKIKAKVLEVYGREALYGRMSRAITKKGREHLDAWRHEHPNEDPSNCFTSDEELKYTATAKAVLADSGDAILNEFAEWGEWSAVASKDIPMLEDGVDMPIHTVYGLANTMRTTSRRMPGVPGGNFQNWRRNQGALAQAGIRECVQPREGYCYTAVDVSQMENCTLAEVIFQVLGRTHMVDMLNASPSVDLHANFASELLGRPYEEIIALKDTDKGIKNARGLGKVNNYGRAGGMGNETLVFFARQSYKIHMTLEDAKRCEVAWRKSNPDVVAYLRWIRTLQNPETGLYEFTIPGAPGDPVIWRRGVTFSSAANGHFQGLGARMMKWIGWELTREAWLDRRSVLFGQRIAAFIHDEFLYETPIGKQHEVAERVMQAMGKGYQRYCPHIKIGSDPVAMAVWSKSAKEIRDPATGHLEIWTPERKPHD